jgi:hypothetical protein
MSTALEAYFAARIYQEGQALRRTTLRHVHLADPPLGIAMWRLGGERFRAAAIAWGPLDGPFQLAVPGEPRNRDLYFAALQPFAADLCVRVRLAAAYRVERQRGSVTEHIPADAPQIVVPNRSTVAALGLLGRYLAYLSDRGGVTPDPALIEAGKHLRFYARNARVPGQALLVPLDQLVADHWATLLSPFEQANLAALDAQISPGSDRHPFEASFAAEASARIGPEPTEDIDRETEALLARFNAARGGSTDPASVGPLVEPLRSHYRGLVSPVWDLMGRVIRRERGVTAAPSVQRRFESDREAFGRHVDWVVNQGGYYRTTDTPRQAVMTLRRLEESLARFEADRAVEDPACMIPHLLDGSAVRGTVASLTETKVVVKVNAVRRAVMVLDSPDTVILPLGKQLWWTATAGDYPWEVQSVQPGPGGVGSQVSLMLTAKPTPSRLPCVGAVVTLSTLCTSPPHFGLPPPVEPPWTHRPSVPPPSPEPIDFGDSEQPAAPVDAAAAEDPGRYT